MQCAASRSHEIQQQQHKPGHFFAGNTVVIRNMIMKTLAFVIPVYNESARIAKTLQALKQGISSTGLKLEEIIFVNDGSTDNTGSLISDIRVQLEQITGAKVTLLSYDENRGKGYAIRLGMQAATSDYILFFDADMSTPLEELNKFAPFIEKNIDVVIGTRKNGHSTVIKHQPFHRELLGKGFTLLSNVILNTWVTDFTCGFKAFSREAKDRVFSVSTIDRWGYDAEILHIAQKKGLTMKEVAVQWANDDRTKVNLLKDIPQTLADLMKIRFTHLRAN